MVDPLVAGAVDVVLGTEGHHVDHVLRTLVHQRALASRERHFLHVVLDEVLADLGADRLEQVAKVREDRVVAAQRGARLQHVPGAQQRQRAADAQSSEEPTSELQSLMRSSYAVFCLQKKKKRTI